MEHYISNFRISLGEINLCFNSVLPMSLSDDMRKFCVDIDKTDITVNIELMDKMIALPPAPCGDDLLLNYYNDGLLQYAVAKPGTLDPVTAVVYSSDFSKATVYINEKEHPGAIRTINKVLQLFPIRQLLAHYHAMLLHASQIVVGNKGILFTAPSGTGKSTQAQLWQKHENIEIVCNDRVLLRKNGNCFNTYGYPIDGSSPVCSNKKYELGAIVVLRQGNENTIQRLPALKSLKLLMDQTVVDAWNKDELFIVQQDWIDLINNYPVYLLTCKPDHDAVLCLKQQLINDRVI